ncbi:hypothetical protein BaRGS_00036353 [Batillaria attramentaria]|uniref:Sarcoplasmic reticulum histidine-rich calcium-binding protein-like n=1 Tax=Batillaria attramentaria TaxID=370345 RepID=A0ABD0JC03_9CAEN
MAAYKTALILCVCFAAIGVCGAADETPEAEAEVPEVTEDEVEYAKGSLCGYCEYCKFCKLCDEDCPCETSPTKPNCKMCKYCKYCSMCSAFCDTICKPGGIVDRVSASIISALPTFNRKEVDSDINSVKSWIDKKKDEL